MIENNRETADGKVPANPAFRKLSGAPRGRGQGGMLKPRGAAKPGQAAADPATPPADEAAFLQPFVTGRLEPSGQFGQTGQFGQVGQVGQVGMPGRDIPVVSTRLTPSDRAGAFQIRWGIGRNHYRVRPGIYAAGSPGRDSPVLVTANYKLSFDSLRKELSGIDAWILVLDTKGVNVWCAAGKGTFGTAELVARVARTGLAEVVSHRRLILPQLGACGVSASEVARKTGFSVVYGPVRASDIPVWLHSGMKKDEAMRTVRFGFVDRLVLIPVELVHSWPFFAAAAALAVPAAFLAGVDAHAGASAGALSGLPAAWAVISGILAGGILAGTAGVPAFLPWLPFRAFGLKGAVLGAVWGVSASLLAGAGPGTAIGAGLVCASVSAFLGMNFTGCSTFTSQTGAQFEVEKGIIPMIAGMVSGIVLGGLSLAFGF